MRSFAGCVLAICGLLLSGCAANLKAVRDFADETKKVSVAFNPLLTATVTQCQEREKSRRLYTGTTKAASFDPVEIGNAAAATCQPIADENETAKAISTTLANYADKLSALAADGVASSVDDDYDALLKKLGQFENFPKDKVAAVVGLVKFLTRVIISGQQRREVEQALSHEDAIGTLGDALVLYSDRVYGGYIKDRTRDNADFMAFIKEGSISMPEMLAKLQLIHLASEQAQLAEQRKVIDALSKAVGQMKASLKDLRSNLNNLSDEQRFNEVAKLAKEVRGLYQQLDKAF
jgi:uncharacterized coiled-coil protein SlyX